MFLRESEIFGSLPSWQSLQTLNWLMDCYGREVAETLNFSNPPGWVGPKTFFQYLWNIRYHLIFSWYTRSQNIGKLLFAPIRCLKLHSLPTPEFWESFFSFPSHSRIMRMFFLFPYRSQIVGMDFFHSLPVPEFAITQTGIKTGIGVLWEIPDF